VWITVIEQFQTDFVYPKILSNSEADEYTISITICAVTFCTPTE